MARNSNSLRGGSPPNRCTAKDGNNASDTPVVKVVAQISDIEATKWDACANPDPNSYDPFISHGFLKALEDAATLAPETGWYPQHLLIEAANGDTATGDTAACMPCYLKSHSQGEFIFDQGWAEAYMRAGGDYYPKLQCAVPFTPVPGRRLLVHPGADEQDCQNLLSRAAIELARRHDASSLHITFLSQPEWARLGSSCASPASASPVDTFLQRTGSQFHWMNDGYRSFDDFLATLASRKRKSIRKERKQALESSITIRHLTGSDIKEHHWDAFFEFYLDTSSRKWGQAYLNREFFSHLHAAMPEQCLLILCERDGAPIAGALNLIGGDCLYGRYWGAVEHHPFLHFEVCYYQAIDIAIERGLARVEAGAQGEHKLARGYRPTPTYSLHWIADPNFRSAVADYLVHERAHADIERKALAEFTPFKKGS